MRYPDRMTLRPLTGWPLPETRQRRRSQFSTAWSDTLALLDRELNHLEKRGGNPQSVLQIALREQDFRVDGMPRASSLPDHPGVILSIEPSGKPPLSFPCDTFDRWQDNVRAIALTLESLRRIERYGASETGQQYRGWQAIESKPSGFDTAEAALRFLAVVAKVDDTNPDHARGIYRGAVAVAHPDRNNGDHSQWDRVEAAGRLLRTVGMIA